MKLTNSQSKWLANMSALSNRKIELDHFMDSGKAVFSVEDSEKWAVAIVGKRGHWEYSEVIMKAK